MAALARITPGELSEQEHDKLESKANAVASTIRSLRNMSSPVNKVPVEVLAVMFSHLIDYETPQSFLPDTTEFNPAIQTVSRVCTTWREAALGFPGLWSIISHSEGPLPLLAIQRSFDAPLRVYVNEAQYSIDRAWDAQPPTALLPSSLSIRLLDVIIPQAHRIKELHIINADVNRFSTSALITTPLPNLVSLTFSMSPQTTPWSPTHITAPGWMFGGIFPQLRQLTLQWAPIFPLHIFAGLTHLCLIYQSLVLSSTLVALEVSPQLEELDILGSGPIVDSTSHNKVVMSSLCRLCLSFCNAGSSIAVLLDFLVFPRAIESYLWLDMVDEPMGPSSLATIFLFYSSQGDGLKELRITKSYQDPYYHSSWRSEHRYALISTSDTLQVDGKFHPSEFILEAPTMLILGGVQTLWLGSAYVSEPTLAEWRTFSSLRSLITLVISRRSSHPLLSALTSPKDPNGEPDGELLCTHLETLRIYNDHHPSVLRLSIFAEQRDRCNCRLKLVDIISVEKNRRRRHDDTWHLGLPFTSWSDAVSIPDANINDVPPWPQAVVSDLLHLHEYVDRVEYMKVETDPDWDVVLQWPPKVFAWAHRCV